MNTLEVKINHTINSFSDLYKYAKKQFINYEKLEGIDNWKEYGFSIDCSIDQMKFKDMLQIRFIEELTEATHSLDDISHFMEEITDALNFFLSAYVMLGVDFTKLKNPDDILYKRKYTPIIPTFDECSLLFYPLVDKVGYLCNLLKNRPWAQSNYLVSMLDFNERLEDLWNEFWLVIKKLKLNKTDIFELFERKYLVNKWRIQTGY